MPLHRPTRLERRSATRNRILAAAEAVICRTGFNCATIELIAEEAGFTRGAVYSNFCGKESIIVELLERHMKCIEVELDALFDNRSEDLISSICKWLHTAYIASRAPSLVVEFQLLCHRHPVFLGLYLSLQDAQALKLAVLIERHPTSANTCVSALCIANTLITLAQGLHLQRLVGNFSADDGTAHIFRAALLAMRQDGALMPLQDTSGHGKR